MKKSSRNFATTYGKLSCNFTTFSCKIVVLPCAVSGLAKQNMSLQYLYVLKMANYQRNRVLLLNYTTITLSSD